MIWTQHSSPLCLWQCLNPSLHVLYIYLLSHLVGKTNKDKDKDEEKDEDKDNDKDIHPCSKFLFVIAPGWEEPSGYTIDKNRFLTPLLHQVPAKSNFSSCALFSIFWHTRLGGKVKWEYLEDIILPPRQNILGVSGCYKKSWEMGKHRGDFTQNFNRDDARLLFLCPKLSKNPTHKLNFVFSKWTIDHCIAGLPLRPLCLFVGQNLCQSRSAIFTICSAFYVLHYKIPSFGPKQAQNQV